MVGRLQEMGPRPSSPLGLDTFCALFFFRTHTHIICSAVGGRRQAQVSSP